MTARVGCAVLLIATITGSPRLGGSVEATSPSAPPSATSVPASDTDLARQLATGSKAFQEADYERAVQLFLAGAASARRRGDTRDAAIFLSNAGVAYEKLARHDEALASHREALAIDRANGNSRGEANDLGNLATVYRGTRRYADALASIQEALAIDRALGNAAAELADAGEEGRILQALARFDDALISQRRALVIARARHDRVAEATILDDIGTIDADAARYDEALAAHRAALAINLALHDRDAEANELGNIGKVLNEQDRYAAALTMFKRSLAIHRETHDRADESVDLANIGHALEHLGLLPDALDARREWLALARERLDRVGEMNALTRLAHVFTRLGRYTEAQDALRQTLAGFRDLKDRSGEALALKFSGDLNTVLGHDAEALTAYQASWAIHRDTGSTNAEAGDLADISGVYVRIGHPELALAALDRVRAGGRTALERRSEATTLSALGNVYSGMGRYRDSLVAYAKALRIEREIHNRIGEAIDLVNIGYADSALRRYDDALTAHRRALAISRSVHNEEFEANALLYLALTYSLAGHDVAALPFATKSVALKRKLGSATLWQALSLRALAEASSGPRFERAARADYDAALDRIETVRAGIADDRDRTPFFVTTLDTYDAYIAFLAKQHRRAPAIGDDRRAFDVFERKAARAALEQIAASAARHYTGVPSAVVQRDEAADVAVKTARDLYSGVLVNTPADQAAIRSAQSRVDTANHERAALDAEIQVRYPAYHGLRRPRPIRVEELQRDALAPGELMLVYDVLDEGSVLWTVSRDGFHLYPLPGRRVLDPAVARVTRHVDAIEAGGTTPSRDIGGFAADSYALFRMLVPNGAAAALRTATSVIVVPSGPLYRIPFAALVSRDPARDPGLRYLIHDVPISYVPSASLLGIERRSYGAHARARASFLAFANPTFPQRGVSSAVAGRDVRPDLQFEAMRSVVRVGANPAAAAGTFAALPGTATEAEAVRSVLGAPVRSVVAGDDATRRRVLQMNASAELKDYRYVLFATHAVLPDQIAGLTQPAIVLAHPELGDGFLTMADVFDLSLDADLVMLSACDTGVVANPRGEGISGLTRAFLFAGTPAISVTLWQVDDDAAPRITPQVFAAMRSGATAAEALRRAQIAMLASSDVRSRHPFEWAPFVLFGDAGRGKDSPLGAPNAPAKANER